MNTGRGNSSQGTEIDAVGRFAARTFDFQPREAAVDRLINSWRRLDGFSVAPHSFIPALAVEVIGSLDQGVTLGAHLPRLRGENASHRSGFGQLLAESFAVATRQWRGVILRGHITLDCNSSRLPRIEGRPAAVVVAVSGALLAACIQQAAADVLPDGVCPKESHSIDGLYFDNSIAAAA